MSGMAEVLAEHRVRWVLTNDPDYDERMPHVGKHVAECVTCGPTEVPESEHQAAMLTAAGFGPVKEAQAEAWDSAYQTGVDDERISQSNAGIAGCFCHSLPCQCFIAPARANPYRAAAVRGEA